MDLLAKTVYRKLHAYPLIVSAAVVQTTPESGNPICLTLSPTLLTEDAQMIHKLKVNTIKYYIYTNNECWNFSQKYCLPSCQISYCMVNDLGSYI